MRSLADRLLEADSADEWADNILHNYDPGKAPGSGTIGDGKYLWRIHMNYLDTKGLVVAGDYEQEAIDNLIDWCEERRDRQGYLLSQEDERAIWQKHLDSGGDENTQAAELEDMISGGNHGRYLSTPSHEVTIVRVGRNPDY